MKRRSFFNRIANAAAIVALAPQIAFGVLREQTVHAAKAVPALEMDEWIRLNYAVSHSRQRRGSEVEMLFDSPEAVARFKEMMRAL